MKFELKTYGLMYDGVTREAYEKLGFKFEAVYPHYKKGTRYQINTPSPVIELKTLEDLVKLEEVAGCPLVVEGETITLYDDYP